MATGEPAKVAQRWQRPPSCRRPPPPCRIKPGSAPRTSHQWRPHCCPVTNLLLPASPLLSGCKEQQDEAPVTRPAAAARLPPWPIATPARETASARCSDRNIATKAMGQRQLCRRTPYIFTELAAVSRGSTRRQIAGHNFGYGAEKCARGAPATTFGGSKLVALRPYCCRLCRHYPR